MTSGLEPVLLDHNATTPVHPEVAAAMWPYLTEHWGNPSNESASGRRARKAVDEAREEMAELLGAHPDEIVFTSGGTEANNLALRGAVQARREHAPSEPVRIVTSQVEHPAIREPVALLGREGAQVDRLPVDAAGRVRLDALPAGSVTLGSLILAQNETGTIQPVARFTERVHAAGGLAHTDAAQAVGKIDVDVEELGVDLLSVAGHKLYAPKGIGALYVRRGTPLHPLLRGAGQERGLRPGTENVAGIVGLGTAARLAMVALAAGEDRRQEALRERLWAGLSSHADVRRVSPREGSLPGTLMICVPRRLGREVLARWTEVEASTGSACHAGIDTPAETLLAMGLDADTALGAIRLSLGRGTTTADVDRAVRSFSSTLG